MFQQCNINGAVELVDPDTFAEVADGPGRIAATPKAADGRHSRVIPSADQPVLHQLLELALAHNGIA